MITREFMMTASKIFNAFITSYREYTGNSILDDGPRISSRFYIHKPRRIQKRSNYYGYVNTEVMIVELPSLRKNSYPDKIVVVITAFYDKKPVTLQHFQQRLVSLAKILKQIDSDPNQKHYFIYFIANKFRAGAIEEARRLYHRLNNNGRKAIVKTLTPKDKIYETIVNDLSAFLVKRAMRLLESPGFKLSDGKIFGYPKKFVEYIIILSSRLQGKEPSIEYIRKVREWPVRDLEQILSDLLPRPHAPGHDLRQLDPTTALIYKYRMNDTKNQA